MVSIGCPTNFLSRIVSLGGGMSHVRAWLVAWIWGESGSRSVIWVDWLPGLWSGPCPWGATGGPEPGSRDAEKMVVSAYLASLAHDMHGCMRGCTKSEISGVSTWPTNHNPNKPGSSHTVNQTWCSCMGRAWLWGALFSRAMQAGEIRKPIRPKISF